MNSNVECWIEKLTGGLNGSVSDLGGESQVCEGMLKQGQFREFYKRLGWTMLSFGWTETPRCSSQPTVEKIKLIVVQPMDDRLDRGWNQRQLIEKCIFYLGTEEVSVGPKIHNYRRWLMKSSTLFWNWGNLGRTKLKSTKWSYLPIFLAPLNQDLVLHWWRISYGMVDEKFMDMARWINSWT